MNEVTNETPLAMMTLGQLKDSFLTIKEPSSTQKRYVYGIDGICSIFHCGRNKAQQLKMGVIKAAVSQHGRKIITDVDLAMKLYAENAK